MISKSLKIFFSGIGGSGMSAIAGFMADRGNLVAGSDRAFDAGRNVQIKDALHRKRIKIHPQDGSGINNTFELVVFSTSVEEDQPEYLKAESLGIPLKTRPQFLADLSSSFRTIAVTGTSGKSTASGLLAFLMNKLGLGPNFIGGGVIKQFKSPANQGNYLAGKSSRLVIEACESDGTIVNYRPEHSIVLNLALDHNPVEKTAGMFQELITNTEKLVILNADDDNLESLTADEVITFSIDQPSDFRAEDITYNPLSTDFTLQKTEFSLSLPGRHNLLNALSCIAMLSESGIPIKAVSDILPYFRGIERRFDIHLNSGQGIVIDDYAHNPHKISALMKTAGNLSRNICYIFQPHGFAPVKMMKNEYISTFAANLHASDHLILLPIFYAGGSASRDVSSQDIADGIDAEGGSVEVVAAREDILKRVNEHKNYVIIGARDETLADLAEEIAGAIKSRQ